MERQNDSAYSRQKTIQYVQLQTYIHAVSGWVAGKQSEEQWEKQSNHTMTAMTLSPMISVQETEEKITHHHFEVLI